MSPTTSTGGRAGEEGDGRGEGGGKFFGRTLSGGRRSAAKAARGGGLTEGGGGGDGGGGAGWVGGARGEPDILFLSKLPEGWAGSKLCKSFGHLGSIDYSKIATVTGIREVFSGRILERLSFSLGGKTFRNLRAGVVKFNRHEDARRAMA